jgi:hypothetical protein
MPWNYGDILDAISSAVPSDAPALAHVGKIITNGEANKRSNKSGP